MSAKDITDLFDSIPEGALFKSDKNFNKTFLKPKQNPDYHLDTMVISLSTGNILHFSRVIGTQVHWGSAEPTSFPYVATL